MFNKKLVYNAFKILVSISALMMSFEYYFFWLKWHNYFYIGDMVVWFLFSAIMLGEAFMVLVGWEPHEIA